MEEQLFADGILCQSHFPLMPVGTDVGDTTAEGQGTIVAAVHPDLTSSSSAPNPPVQVII